MNSVKIIIKISNLEKVKEAIEALNEIKKSHPSAKIRVEVTA